MTQNTRLFKKTLLAVTVAFASGQSMAFNSGKLIA